jgi:hypothetical protein
MLTQISYNVDTSRIEGIIVNCSLIAVSTVLFLRVWSRSLHRYCKGVRNWDETMVGVFINLCLTKVE